MGSSSDITVENLPSGHDRPPRAGPAQGGSLPGRVRWLRRSMGLSQRALAQAVGRERSWVAHLERGTLNPDRHQVRLLASALEVSPVRLCRGTTWSCPGAPQPPLARLVARFQRTCPPAPPPAAAFAPRSSATRPLLAAVPPGRPGLWAALGRMGLQGEEAWVAALALAVRGGFPARLSPARLGFPVPLVLPDGSSAAHVRRHCLAWEGGGVGLVVFGATRVARGGRQLVLPLVLAASGERNAFFAAHPERPCLRLPGVEWVVLRGLCGAGAEALFRQALGVCGA